jgi:deazaflavin-dependent oxidoreductase (nitroreductase family)
MTVRWPVVIVRSGLYANPVGIIQEFEYQVRKPNAAQVAMQHIAGTRPGAWFFARTLPHIDRVLLRLSQGQVTLPAVVAGIPVLTVTTTGARTRQRRTAPLLGVPAGEDIAVIGTSFGQPRTPGWYHNMRADPKVEVTYRNKTIKAIAREAGDDEGQAIWDRARTIYAGYEAYASRIKNRKIHIMILSAEGLQKRGSPPGP